MMREGGGSSREREDTRSRPSRARHVRTTRNKHTQVFRSDGLADHRLRGGSSLCCSVGCVSSLEGVLLWGRLGVDDSAFSDLFGRGRVEQGLLLLLPEQVCRRVQRSTRSTRYRHTVAHMVRPSDSRRARSVSSAEGEMVTSAELELDPNSEQRRRPHEEPRSEEMDLLGTW